MWRWTAIDVTLGPCVCQATNGHGKMRMRLLPAKTQQ